MKQFLFAGLAALLILSGMSGAADYSGPASSLSDGVTITVNDATVNGLLSAETITGVLRTSSTVSAIPNTEAPASAGVFDGFTASGSMEAGNYSYKLSYVTADGETNLGVSTGPVENGSALAIGLASIPTSTDNRVTGKKLFRLWNGDSCYRYLTTLAVDQIDYLDETGVLGGPCYDEQTNTTIVGSVAIRTAHVDGDFTVAGSANISVQYAASSGTSTYATSSGSVPGYSISPNITLGAGSNTSAGLGNIVIGTQSLLGGTGSQNVVIGNSSMFQAGTATYNTSVGEQALQDVVDGHHNTVLGDAAGWKIRNGSYNVCIGVKSCDGDGPQFNSDYKLYIDSRPTTSGETPLIYGEFDTRKMVVNGALYSTTSITAPILSSSTYSLNHAACFKENGVIGYCTSVVQSDGTCTCN